MNKWMGVVGSVWLARRKLADVAEWQFDVERPQTDDEFTRVALVERLSAAKGLFIIDDGGPEPLVEAVRNEETLTLRFEAGRETYDIPVRVDPALVRQSDVARVDLFLFDVAGDVRLAMKE